MGVTIDTNSRKAIIKIENLGKLTKEGIKDASYISGRGLVQSTSAEILRKPKGGRVYVSRTRSGAIRRHTASAPGETHANLSGALLKSLDYKVSGALEIEFGYGVTKNDAPDYAESVEFGTRNMDARPSLQNGIKGERRNIQNNLQREIGKRLGDKVII